MIIKYQLFKFCSILLSLSLSSCSVMFNSFYGMKKMEAINQNEIIHYSKKYKIPLSESYEMDSAYFTFLKSADTTKYKNEVKNHYQPLQALYYNNSGALESFQINCFVGGFPNLKWNINDNFSTFPPKKQTPLDSLVPLNVYLKYLNPVSNSAMPSVENYDFVVIVHWNRFMGRQSKNLIDYVQENSKLAKDQKVKILYVNTDNVYASLGEK